MSSAASALSFAQGEAIDGLVEDPFVRRDEPARFEQFDQLFQLFSIFSVAEEIHLSVCSIRSIISVLCLAYQLLAALTSSFSRSSLRAATTFLNPSLVAQNEDNSFSIGTDIVRICSLLSISLNLLFNLSLQGITIHPSKWVDVGRSFL